MQKEILTLKNIKKDLHREIKSGYVRLTLLSAFFIFAFLILFMVFKIDFTYVFREMLAILIGEVVIFCVIIRLIIKQVNLHLSLKSKTCIVKDKLVGLQIRERQNGSYRRRIYDEDYCLVFSQYGEYIIPDENYKWSSDYSMSSRGVYNYANNGDEFYLVLSKRHTGKIMFAYNTKMFELE